MTEVVLACAGGLTAGYAQCRWRPWPRLVSRPQTREIGTFVWWAAQPMLAVALALTWALHSRRTQANARTWRSAPARVAALRDPQRAERRTR
ncbi:hypothetical protein ACE1SV_63480 [Streptomyces sennicomposti]